MPATSKPKNTPTKELLRRFSKLAPYLWVLPALIVYGIFKVVSAGQRTAYVPAALGRD